MFVLLMYAAGKETSTLHDPDFWDDLDTKCRQK